MSVKESKIVKVIFNENKRKIVLPSTYKFLCIKLQQGFDIEGKKIKFTLEQANVYGLGLKDGGKEQVSAKWDSGKVNSFADEAVAKIKKLFENIKAVDGKTSFEVNTATVDVVLM